MNLYLPNGRLPPGFRFAPTKEELAVFYLKRKVLGKSLYNDFILELDIYQYAPQDLRHFVCCALVREELVWHFFCRPRKRSAAGPRTCRATDSGYWKPTGEPRVIIFKNRCVAKIKTLVFYEGKSPNGRRTNWVMHEYNLDDQELAAQGIIQDTFVLCKIFEKPQQGPQNGAEYGAPFIEEAWEMLDVQEADGGHGIEATDAAGKQNNSTLGNTTNLQIGVSEENGSVSGLTDTSGLPFGTPALVPHASKSEQGVSCVSVTDYTSLSSSAPTVFSHPSTSSKQVSLSSSPALSSHPSTSKQDKVTDHTSLASSSAPSLSSQPSDTYKQFPSGDELGGVNQTPISISKVDVASMNLEMPVPLSVQDDMDWDALHLSDFEKISLPSDSSDEFECNGGMSTDDLKYGFYE